MHTLNKLKYKITLITFYKKLLYKIDKINLLENFILFIVLEI